jgi:hypothetical protein
MSAMQTAILLHLSDTRGVWPFKINKSGRKEWLQVQFCPAAVWVYHGAKRMRDDYRATCESKPTLDGYRSVPTRHQPRSRLARVVR